MLMAIQKGIIMVCTLAGFSGFPPQVEGELVLKTNKFVVISVQNKDKTEIIELTIPNNKCEVKVAK